MTKTLRQSPKKQLLQRRPFCRETSAETGGGISQVYVDMCMLITRFETQTAAMEECVK